MFHGRRLRFPEATWLALGYLLICFLSTLRAASPYLGLVEMWRLVKLFIVYLFAVNCVDSKSALRMLTMVAVIILVTQAAVTVVRFETGYYTPFGFGETPSGLGETQWDKSEIEHYLTVDQSAQGSAIRSFGTITSPGSTARLCAMVVPFALFLCVPNPMFRRPFVFAALTASAVLGLVLTFTRVYYITIAVQFVIAFFIMIRDRMLKREEAVMVALVSLAVVAAATPMLRHQFSVRKESMSVRLHQYDTTFRMILDNPLLGVGLNNGTAEKPKYVTVTYNPYDPDTQFDLEPTHNTYLSLASEIGVIGAFLFVAFFTRVALTAWQHSRYSTDPEIKLVANALVVAFCGLAVNGLMDPLHEYPVLVLLWLYAGLSLNLEGMEQRVGDHESQAIRRKP
jgi:O-antigen ligase